ncbi:MAG: aminotransferase class III-fold pyridoxal phosphate-dependent enzyme, partial [Actinomycetota bacterium]|nr:aminotransferase class III-fold pyridoxal phosphate-dependent enzyme [Actinomycetota bacterium]
MTSGSLEGAEAPRLVTELPGPKAREVLERDGRTTSPSLPRAYPLVPARGAGSVVHDVDGNAFLDVNAGIAVTSTGHCHPKVVEAIQRQAAELIHYSASDFYLPNYSELTERLEEIAPMSGGVRTFLTNSGTEAVEAAIKLARWATGRQYVIAFYGSFHGRSYGSVSLTASKVSYRAGFGPLLPGVLHAYYGDGRDMPVPPRGVEEGFPTIAHLEGFLMRKIVAPEEVAAIVVEPVLGEGGYIVPPDGWLQALRELCDRHGILLICDEVQSGMGRTGKMWAVEHFGVEPDIVLSGKGIASGMPLGAMVAKDSVMTWTKGTHGSTYGGNPLSCAAAIATLDVIRSEELLENAAKVGELLMNGLRDVQSRYDAIREVRGLGLMIGIELREKAAPYLRALLDRGIIALPAGA